MTTYLTAILEHHRARAGADDRDLDDMLAASKNLVPARPFAAALTATTGVAVIAEVKRRSPSKGDLNATLDPAALARQYEQGGATCVSVLTDADHFGGSPEDLVAARAAITLPVLRKDFTVDARDVVDARLMGADCVLLIVAALGELELVEYLDVARTVGLDALVEVHDEPELELALQAGATLIGVNQRDLTTFEVDSERAARIGAAIPGEVVRVAESDIRGADDARRLAAVGYDAVLVGETLVTSSDPAGAVASLRI
ncbi:indole-3-glycerol phosphate synthase TrpC [soil metagenome]